MKRHVLPLLTTALLAVAIAGCTNKSAKLDSDPITTGSTSTAAPAAEVGSYIKTRELEQAWQQKPGDETIGLAYADALNKLGQHEQARSKYNKALALQPGSIAVQNNLGMSFALQGKLPEAEKVLNMALAEPGSAAIPRVRQNLALVVGLQGRFDEARKIAAADLPPAQVEMNLAYLQQMLAKPNTWAELSKDNAAN